MIYVGIDVLKDKHDCFITNSDVILFRFLPFRITGMDLMFFFQDSTFSSDVSNIKVGLRPLDTTSYNLLGYLIEKVSTFVINSTHTNLLQKKSQP